MLAKAWNDFSTPTRKRSCRSSSCASACLRCASVNRCFVLSCRRSLTRPTIGQPSCDWRRLSRRSSPACAVWLRRLMSRSASESYGSWSKMSWWGTTPSPFVTASQFHRAPHKMAVRRQVGQTKVTFCVRGVISPLLSNLYMRRFVLGWKKLGHEKRLNAYIVNYADDFVICCRDKAEEALGTMRHMMTKLKLTVNETKTRVCKLPEEKFDFLGYTFGRCYSPKTGRAYLGTTPSKKRVQRICKAISMETGQNKTLLDRETVIAKLNHMMIGWANYFYLGPVSKAYRAIERHARKRLRQWLCAKYQMKWPATKEFPEAALHEVLGLVRLTPRTSSFPWATP